MRSVLSIPVLVAALLLGTTACTAGPVTGTVSPSATTGSPSATTTTGSSSATTSPPVVPAFDHVVVVVEENHGLAEALTMPYLAELRRTGATFRDSHGVTHPSEPNYLALWSGSTHQVDSDTCPVDLGSTPSLGSQLLASGHTVAAYSQGLPQAGSLACSSGSYARKHNPLADFGATAGADHNLPFSAFPSDYSTLPSVALVVPDLDHDAHDGSLATADDWLRSELGGYATWAASHDSLLIVTFDEQESDKPANRILTVFSGAHVRPGSYSESIDHVRVLHTIESAFGLPPLGSAAPPITDVWR
jgi:phosphatidylinositol-3-phosphatase